MKTRRGLMVVMASFILSLSSLAVTFTATGSGRPPDQRKVVLTVRVVDDGGREITGAHISVFQGEQHLGDGDSNAQGIAQMNVVVNTDGDVVLILEVSKPGMGTKQHTLKLGTNFPARLPIEDVQLKPGADSEKFLLTVKAVDRVGTGIKQAHVNIYLGSFTFGTDSYVRPPTYQEDTNADGMRNFDIPINPGQDLDITIEVSREDMQTMRRTVTLRTGLLTLDQLETFKLSPRTEAAQGFPTVNIKVGVKDDQGDLEGALVAVTSDALTPSQRATPHQKSTGPDGSATVAIELMSADAVEHIGITVSKPGYKDFKDVMDVVNSQYHRAEGKTFDYAKPNKLGRLEPLPIILEKLPDAAFEVRVTVLDGQTNRGIPDAEIVLDGPDYATRSTDGNGVATLPVDKPGSYKVRISQDYYERINDVEVRLLPQDKHPDVPAFRLRAKPKKDSAGDTIDITVLAKDSIDADSKTHPVPKAAVSDGRGTTYTDENGRATLRGAYDMPQPITVTAKDYKPATKRVAAARVLTLNGKGTATFVLEPELTDSSPIRLIVEVRDAADTNKKIDTASVLLRFKGKIIGQENTDASGVTPAFNLGDSADLPLSKLRSGLRVDVQRDTYKIKWSDITPDRLEPSLDVKRVTVFLERDTDDIRRAVEALEPRVFSWNSDSRADNSGATKAFIDKALAARQEAEALANEITAGIDGIIAASDGKLLCGEAAPFLLSIRSAEAKANQKAAQIETTLKNASAAAGTCSSQAQAESLRAIYRQAIQTLAEIGKLNKQAVKDHDALTQVAKKNLAAKDLIAQLRQKLANIARLQNVAAENANSADAVYGRTADRHKALISRQFNLKAELAVLTVKAQAEPGVPNDLLKRIGTMEQMLASINNSSSYGGQPEQSGRQAVGSIGEMGQIAAARIEKLDGLTCKVATLDEAVNGIDTTFTNAQFEIGLAADLPKQADDCVAKATQQTNTNSSVNTSTGSDTTENKPDDKVSASTGPGKERKPAIDEDPGIKIAQPSNPNSQDTSSGGFWESAKAGKKKVENAVNNKPANQTNSARAGETSANTGSTNTATNKTGNNPPPTVEQLPEDSTTEVAANKPARKTNKPTTTVEEISETYVDNPPLSNRPASKSTNKPPAVEEIPETGSTNVASNRSASKSANKPPVVEEIPETGSTNVASNRSRTTSPQVEKIPETRTNNRSTASDSGRNRTNSSSTSGNSQTKDNPRKEEKPRDPNKPGTPATKNTGGENNPNQRSRFSLSGTWKAGNGWVYAITQEGSTFTWSMSAMDETGNGAVEGTNVSAKWSGKNGSGSATGTLIVDGAGRATRIQWSNGTVFTKN